MATYILSVIALQFLLSTSVNADNCVEDYFPCSCTEYGDGPLSVECDGVPVQQVAEVFARTTSDIYRLDLTLSSSDSIPQDFLSGKQVTILRISCAFNSFIQLAIDSSAFSPVSRTNQFILADCDLIRLDFAFLNGFQLLNELSIAGSRNIQTLSTLPVLSSLKMFSVFDCQGFEDLTSIQGLSTVKLETLKLNSNQLSDHAISTILNSVDASSLLSLSLNDNQLTEIPERVSSFPALIQFYLSGNKISILTSGSLTFSGQVKQVYLPSVSLKTIEPGAFQGDFRYAQLTLDNNNLKVFESEVFLPILEQMIQTALGAVYLYSNPIDCSGCNLAWLIRDHRIMLYVIQGGTCSNGTSFENLLASGYNQCAL